MHMYILYECNMFSLCLLSIVLEDASFIEKFSVIILANPSLAEAHLLSSVCWDAYVPLVVVKSYGFIGECRLQLRQHDMIETKPDPEQIYLRMNAPFESLQKFYDGIDFSNQSPEEFAHTPYMAILHHQAQQWADCHGGKKPTGRAEIKEFKELLKTVGSPVEYYEDGTKKQTYLRDNYKEAQLNVGRFFEPVEVPPVLQELFSQQELMTISGNSKINDFKVLLNALKEYIEGPGEGVHWPLSGVVPDLTATSDMYMTLQQIYQKKAEDDRLSFKKIVSRLLLQCDRAADEISDEVIQIFCRNILNLRFLSAQCSIRDRDVSPNREFARSFLSEETYWDDPIQVCT
jgi:amyloid beta precursor protein binding protein 1